MPPEPTDEVRESPKFIVPHSDHGDPECCGLILPEVRGEETDLKCNECGAMFRTLPTAEAEQELSQVVYAGKETSLNST